MYSCRRNRYGRGNNITAKNYINHRSNSRRAAFAARRATKAAIRAAKQLKIKQQIESNSKAAAAILLAELQNAENASYHRNQPSCCTRLIKSILGRGKRSKKCGFRKKKKKTRRCSSCSR